MPKLYKYIIVGVRLLMELKNNAFLNVQKQASVHTENASLVHFNRIIGSLQ